MPVICAARSDSIRETYRCGGCGASLRYREQARLILNHFSREGSERLADLATESEFQNLKIYEPGLIGPFRKVLSINCPVTVPPIFGMMFEPVRIPRKVSSARI